VGVGQGRITYDGGANSMFQFRLEMGGDGTKRYQKMKRR
jgi:hypothetical protein